MIFLISGCDFSCCSSSRSDINTQHYGKIVIVDSVPIGEAFWPCDSNYKRAFYLISYVGNQNDIYVLSKKTFGSKRITATSAEVHDSIRVSITVKTGWNLGYKHYYINEFFEEMSDNKGFPKIYAATPVIIYNIGQKALVFRGRAVTNLVRQVRTPSGDWRDLEESEKGKFDGSSKVHYLLRGKVLVAKMLKVEGPHYGDCWLKLDYWGISFYSNVFRAAYCPY